MDTTSPDPATPSALPPGPDQRRGEMPTWQRRTIIATIVVAATALLLWGTSVIQTDGGGAPLDGTIVSLTPVDDGQAPRQTPVGAELRPGYDGRLTINGIAIPEEQMEGAIDPKSVSVEDLARYGVRPNNRNRVFFSPGPDKVIEELTTGRVTVVLRYFQDKREASTARTVTWSFRVD